MNPTPDRTLDPQQFIAELQRQLAESNAERDEALARETATAEVLQVINSSPGDLAPVFDAILEKAHSLCGIAQGSLELYDGERFRAVAIRGLSEAFGDVLRQGSPASDNPATRPLIEGERFSYIPDMAAADYSVERTAAETEGVRTLLCVPLRRDGQLLGMIASARKAARPFSAKEVALLENFAAQAVIAMENARLITETREALEQQTATAEVLGVINSSPGDLAPVFDAILEKAHSLCEAAFGSLFTYDGECFHGAASHGLPEAIRPERRGPFRPVVNNPLSQLADGAPLAHVPDMRELTGLLELPGPGHLSLRATVEQGGIRTLLMVPLRRDGALLGVISAYRQEVRLFSENQIALLQNFAAQAVIAMENARLLSELRQRTSDLQELLEYQTAISDVLKVISQSGADLDTVLNTLVETAVRICEGINAIIFRTPRGPSASRRFLRSGAGIPGFSDRSSTRDQSRNPGGPDRHRAARRPYFGRDRRSRIRLS